MPSRVVIVLSLAIAVGIGTPLLATTIPCTLSTNTECVTAPTCQANGTCRRRDCYNNHEVTVGEVVTIANIMLETAQYSTCERGDADNDGVMRINDLVIGVNHALHGCGG